MDLSNPGADLLGSTEAALLRVLHRRGEEASGRHLARLAGGLSHASAQRALARLVQTGLVEARVAPSAIFYRANRMHILWESLASMFESRQRAFQLIAEGVAECAGPETSAAVFGSVARGESGPTSDIDVLVVFPDDVESARREATIDTLHDRVESFTGNAVQVFDTTTSQLIAMSAAAEPLIDSLRRDAIALAGPDIRRTLRAAAA